MRSYLEGQKAQREHEHIMHGVDVLRIAAHVLGRHIERVKSQEVGPGEFDLMDMEHRLCMIEMRRQQQQELSSLSRQHSERMMDIFVQECEAGRALEGLI